MAKKKSKNHHKETPTQHQTNGLGMFNHHASQVGGALLTTLIAEVVTITLDRLLQKNSSASTSTQEEENYSIDRSGVTRDGIDSKGDRGSLNQVLATLQPVLQTLQTSMQQPLKDAVATTKSMAQDVPSGVDQVVNVVQDKVPAAIAQPAKSAGAVVVGELVDTAKMVVSAMNSPADDTPKKKKKKHKK